MKKLMIAAAAAAMIGTASATPGIDDVAYQVTYNLKTTIGKAAPDTSQYHLGWDGVSQFWYNDPAVSNYWDASTTPVTLKDTVNFKLAKKGGVMVPTLTPAGLKNNTIMTNLVALAESLTYENKSANQWCLTFSYTKEVCYRIAGTIKIDGYCADNECFAGTATPDLLYTFGGATVAKCTKVELYHNALVAAGAAYNPALLVKKERTGNVYAWAPVDIVDNAKYPQNRTILELSIAGHGTYGKVYDDFVGTRDAMTMVSGYAVGYADVPRCESCCAPGRPLDVEGDCCLIGVPPAGTAVFGTFTIKYNAAETRKLY